jgi:ribosomal protein L27
VGKGGDDTLFATADGLVKFHESRGRRFASIEADGSADASATAAESS